MAAVFPGDAACAHVAVTIRALDPDGREVHSAGKVAAWNERRTDCYRCCYPTRWHQMDALGIKLGFSQTYQCKLVQEKISQYHRNRIWRPVLYQLSYTPRASRYQRLSAAARRRKQGFCHPIVPRRLPVVYHTARIAATAALVASTLFVLPLVEQVGVDVERHRRRSVSEPLADLNHVNAAVD